MKEALTQAAGGVPVRLTALLPSALPSVIGATLMRVPTGAATSLDDGPDVQEHRYLLTVELPRTSGREVAQSVTTLFGLSPAETRVLGGLLDGHTPAEIASNAGTALPTVRTQISSLLAKTGTTSQPQLLVLLRGLRW